MIGALLGSGLSIVGGLIKTGRAKKEERRLAKQAAQYNRTELQNVADSLAVSTLGAEYAMDKSNIATATSIDALQKSGARSLLGGIGKVNQASNDVGNRIQADLDSRQKEIDRIRANDEARIRQIRENRDIANLSGIGNAMNVARQDKSSGLFDIFSGITGAGASLNQMGLFGSGTQNSSNQIQPSQNTSVFAPYMGDGAVPYNPITM